MKFFFILCTAFIVLYARLPRHENTQASGQDPQLTGGKNSVRVLTFNIRYNNPADGVNAWPLRKELVAGLITKNKIDIAGVQEALHGQISDLDSLLVGYNWFGAGRDDGHEQGEYCAILYSSDRFTVVDKNTFWLSETPERAGSLGWDAACVRIVTYGKFRDAESKRFFWLFNTHFDHLGKTAREKSADLILARIKRISGDDPFLLIGDFNAADTSVVYHRLTNHGDLVNPVGSAIIKDARYASRTPVTGPDITFQGFGTVADGERIDYIFVSSAVRVTNYRVITEREDGRYPSDHYPVMADVTFLKASE